MSESVFSSRLVSLLSEWNARRQAGGDCDPAGLCGGDAELWRALEDQIAAIVRLEEQQDALADPSRTVDMASDPTAPVTAFPSPPGLDILDELGRGGMGVVFRAAQRRLNRTVALKMVLSTEGDRAEVARFVAEAEAMAAVRHPNVVQVFDAGEHAGRPYLTMELLTGGTLKDRLRDGGLPPAAVVELLEKLARGVQAAHDQGIVHRDLKPGNVLFDADGTPKVTDFGLAKRAAVDQTQTNAVMGTPAYMPPEQARGEGKFVGPPADVWSLGVILYECLAGRRPFAGSTTLDVLDRIVRAQPERPSKFAPVPRDLERVCLKCLEKEPAERYQSAAALADDLTAFREGRPVSARPVPAAVKAWKWTRRNPFPAGLAAAVFVGLLATAGFFRQRQLTAVAESQRASAELKAEQEKLAEQNLRTRQLLLSQAELATQRGAAKEAIRALDAAEQAGESLTSRQRLERVRLLFDTYAVGRGRSELAQIDTASLPPEQLGRWHLYRGMDRIGVDDEGAKADLRLAVDSLPDGSGGRLFAQGLLETEPLKALDLFGRAIDSDPTALAPRLYEMLVNLSLGRFGRVIDRGKTTRHLYPEDGQVALLMYVSYAMSGATKDAEGLIASIRDQYTSEVTGLLQLIAPMLAETRAGGTLDAVFAKPSVIKFFLLDNGAARVAKAFASLGGERGDVNSVIKNSPLCTRAFTRLLGYMVQNVVGRFDAKALFAAKPLSANGSLLTDSQFAEMRAVAEHFPEGFVRQWYAGELLARSDLPYGKGPEAWEAFRPRGSEIAGWFESSWRAEGFFVDARVFSLDNAIMWYGAAALGPPGFPNPDLRLGRKCTDLLRERLTHPVSRSVPIPNYSAYVRFAREIDDPGLEWDLLTQWEKQSPDDIGLWFARALGHFKRGSYEAALVDVRRVLAKDKMAANARDLEARCLERLKAAAASD